MSEEVAAQPGEDGRGIQPLAAPADEQIARRRHESSWCVLRRSIPVVLCLGGILYLQHRPVYWHVANGRIRGCLALAALAAGLVLGVAVGIRRSFPWVGWPPEGTLHERCVRLTLSDLAHGWWQFVWLAPLVGVGTTMASAVAALTVLRPQDLAGRLYAVDLVWYGFAAGFIGFLAGRMARPNAEAITGRGIHTSPDAFVPWSALSHALVDHEDRVIRLYTWRRPWIPRSVLTFQSEAEMDRVLRVLQAHVASLPLREEAVADRLRWAGFLAVWLVAVGAITAATVALLLMPSVLLIPARWTGSTLVWQIAFFVAELLGQEPEAVLLLAAAAGWMLHGQLDRLRGVTWKKIVWEGA